MSSNWYNKDVTSNEGIKNEAVTSQNLLHRETNKATHNLNNSSLWYIDFVFDSQSNLLIQSGVYPSLHPSCDHRIVFAKHRYSLSATL